MIIHQNMLCKQNFEPLLTKLIRNCQWMSSYSRSNNDQSKHRSSCPKVLCKKGVLRNFAKFTRKHLCQRLSFFILSFLFLFYPFLKNHTATYIFQAFKKRNSYSNSDNGPLDEIKEIFSNEIFCFNLNK